MMVRSCASVRSRITCPSVIDGRSGGMMVRAIQAPLQCWKKSSPGLTDESIADMSRPAGGYSGPWKLAGRRGAAGAVDTASNALAVIRQSERIDVDMDIDPSLRPPRVRHYHARGM